MLENITKNTHHNCHQLANECCPLNDLHKKTHILISYYLLINCNS